MAFWRLCAVVWKFVSKMKLHVARNPEVCGARADISMSMHVSGVPVY